MSCVAAVFEHLFQPGSALVKAIEIHHLVPGLHEVVHELLLRVVVCVDFSDCAQLGIGAEHQVDGGGRPFELARGAITTLVNAFG